jgi:hypothetical protein
LWICVVSNNNIQKVREGKTLGCALRMEMYSVRVLCFPINTPGLMQFEYLGSWNTSYMWLWGFGWQVSIDAMFDVQVKRIHQYKRQLLNVLSIIHRADCIKVSPTPSTLTISYLMYQKASLYLLFFFLPFLTWGILLLQAVVTSHLSS